VGAGLKHDRVNHLTRAEPYGKTSPWQPLSALPVRHARKGWSAARGGASARGVKATALQGTLPSPGGRRGSRRARRGPAGTCPLDQAVGVVHDAHGSACKGCAGAWRGGRERAPTQLPGPAGSQRGPRSLQGGKLHPWRRPRGRGLVSANYSGNAHAVQRERGGLLTQDTAR
jgi:hypothetical protein